MDTRKLEIKYDDCFPTTTNRLELSAAKDHRVMLSIYDDATVSIDRNDAIKIIEHLKREFAIE